MLRRLLPVFKISLLGATGLLAAAEDHLVPEPEPFGKTDRYHASLRTYFAEAFQPDVLLRTITIPSFHSESVVGLKKTAEGYMVFEIEPTSMIWEFELAKYYENGSVTTLDKSAKPISLGENKEYQKLKKGLPSSIASIPAVRTSCPLAPNLARRLIGLWQFMLGDAKNPDVGNAGVDGITFYFSAEMPNHSFLEAQTWTPPEGSKSSALAKLATEIAQFSNQVISEQELTQSIKACEKVIYSKEKQPLTVPPP